MSLSDAVIGNVRGRGLMLGVELVKDRSTKAPAKEETLLLFEQLKGDSAVHSWLTQVCDSQASFVLLLSTVASGSVQLISFPHVWIFWILQTWES